mmetsp:Transcript_11854/g.45913  ORF Transcript_11854/g.45913 Transcript_11854/m.45913 type:complete len:595 (+) Transcript_11854:200-1984(+)
MVTSAEMVARCNLVSSPRTMFTMFVSWVLDLSPYALSPRSTMALVTSSVQCTCDAPMTTWPGQSKIHSSRGFSVYETTDSRVTFSRESFMTSSNSSIHFSTAPVSAGSISLHNGTLSPSTDTIVFMVICSVNSTFWTASKHFFINGCTRSGSFPSERISRSSSLERKKKRGNAIFLVSRKSLRPFSTMSSCLLDSSKSSSKFSTFGASTALGAAWTTSMIRRHVVSIVLNAAASVGICFPISSLLKMGSRYSHLAWHLSHWSTMLCSRSSRVPHGPTRSAKGLANGDAPIAVTFTIWSSSTACTSSTHAPSRIDVPVSFQGLNRKSNPSQSATILSSAFSIVYSLDATSLTSASFAVCSFTPLSIRRWSDVNSSFFSSKLGIAMISVIFSQCLVRRPGLQTAWTMGSISLNFSSFSAVASATASGFGMSSPPPFPEKLFTSLAIARTASDTFSSMTSELSLEKGPCIHSLWFLNVSQVMVHSLLNGSNLLLSLVTSVYRVMPQPNKISWSLISSASAAASSRALTKTSTLPVYTSSRLSTSPSRSNDSIWALYPSSFSWNSTLCVLSFSSHSLCSALQARLASFMISYILAGQP